MEVILESESEKPMGRKKRTGKRRHASGPNAPSPTVVADQTGRLLAEREQEWLERLDKDPASFAAVEREVHDQTRRLADRYVAGLLAKASARPSMDEHVKEITASAEVPLRAVEKKVAP